MKFKIAIVEDDMNLVGIYIVKLKLHGYDTLAISDGKNAAKTIEKERPDLILLDILIPHKDGFVILEELRKSKIKEIKNILVIVVSNLANEEDINEAKKFGVYDYLVKINVTPSQIVKKVDCALKLME